MENMFWFRCASETVDGDFGDGAGQLTENLRDGRSSAARSLSAAPHDLAADPMTPLLAAQDIDKYFAVKKAGFGRALTLKAADCLNFDVLPGETLALVGESGCGKSTVSRLLMGLLQPTRGKVIFEGQEVGSAVLPLKAYRRQAQMVFQDSQASLNPRLTAEESVAFPAAVHGFGRREARARSHELLDAVGLAPDRFGNRYPHELSGGQRQRVNIARALVLRPRLVILDEPVSALDKSVEGQVLNLLLDLKAAYGLTYLFISHDLGVIGHIADRVMVMYLGRIIEVGPLEAVFARPAHPYTQALLASRLSTDLTHRRRLPPLLGDPPNPIDPPEGCHFRARCRLAEVACAQARPLLARVSGASAAAPHEAACLAVTPGSGHSQALRTAA